MSEPLFDRTARFYKGLLRAGSLVSWAELMSSTEVVVSANQTWAQQPGAQRLLVLLVNILARCFGTVIVRLPEDVPLVVAPVLVPARATLVDTLRDIVAAIHGPEFIPGPRWETIRLHVGPKPPKMATPAVAADGWRAVLWGADAAPETFRGEPNIVGSVLGALLGATAAVRAFIETATTADAKIAREEGRIRVAGTLHERFGAPLGTVTINGWDLFGFARGPECGPRELGRVVFSSVGAVNGALLVMLVLAGDLDADIDGYEPQTLERSNLNRYWYAVACAVQRLKADIAETIATARVRIVAEPMSVTSAMPSFNAGATVISGADNDEARFATQRLARGRLISLATELEQVFVSVHDPAGGPCLGCRFRGDGVGGGKLPTHPLVAGWAGLFGLLAMLGAPVFAPGFELRLSALRPGDVRRVPVSVRADCPVHPGRNVGEDAPTAFP